MAGSNGFQPAKSTGKPVTEKKKRKRPSKKVPTTVLESSSTNFMDLVQKLTGSAAELASDDSGEKRPKAATSSSTPVVAENSFQSYLHNVIYNDNNNNDSTSSSSQHSNESSPAPVANFPSLFMDPILGALAADEEFYNGHAAFNSSSARGADNFDLSLLSSGSWRDHSEYWYPHMDAMRA